jgi:hypothetical protein
MEREAPEPPTPRKNEIFDPGFSGQTPESRPRLSIDEEYVLAMEQRRRGD